MITFPSMVTIMVIVVAQFRIQIWTYALAKVCVSEEERLEYNRSVQDAHLTEPRSYNSV